MNSALFYSSIIIGIIIITISIYFYSKKLLPLYVITYIGILTSLINHGITSKAAKNLDRTIMLISSAIYIYYGLKINNKTLVKNYHINRHSFYVNLIFLYIFLLFQ